MATQQFCLKWNNYQGNLVEAFQKVLSSEAFSDVTLACDGETIKAHKIVLSACSPFFEQILLNNPCKHPVIILNGIKFENLKTIITFMYQGEVNVSQDDLNVLLKTAENLQVKGLVDVDKSADEPSSHKAEVSHPKDFNAPMRRRLKSHYRNEKEERLSEVPTKQSKKQNLSESYIGPEESSEVHKNSHLHSTLDGNVQVKVEPKCTENYVEDMIFDDEQNYNKNSNQSNLSLNNDELTKEQVSVNPEFSFLPVPPDIENDLKNTFTMNQGNTEDDKSTSDGLSIPIEKEVIDCDGTPPTYDEYPSYHGDDSQSFDDARFSNPANDASQPYHGSDTAGSSQDIMYNIVPSSQTSDNGSMYKVECCKCHKLFSHRQSLMSHYKHKHLDAKRYHCKECYSSFTRKDSLLRHIRQNHPDYQF